MKNKNILISGAGVAGLVLAYWLKRFGFNPTLIEKHSALRTGGYKIDIRGAALEVVKRMGIYPAIVENRTKILRAISVDREGHQVTEMSADLSGARLEGIDLEIMRSHLCLIMKEAIGEIECLFGDSIAQISESKDGVHVEFNKNKSRLFDLVIGADGLHSTVRKIAFGEEKQFSKEFGVFVSVFSIPNFLELDASEIEHFSYRRFLNLYKDRKDTQATVSLAFPSDKCVHSRDEKVQKEYIRKAFADWGWEMPKIMAAMGETNDFYFDATAQIHMPSWSSGRVALVGDAAYSPTPMSGQGTSIAIIGAYVLAGELAEACGDYQKAFSSYEKLLRPFIIKNQKLAEMSARIMQGSFFSRMLYVLLSIMPMGVIHYFKNLGLKRISEAANALTLKDYHEKNR